MQNKYFVEFYEKNVLNFKTDTDSAAENNRVAYVLGRMKFGQAYFVL